LLKELPFLCQVGRRRGWPVSGGGVVAGFETVGVVLLVLTMHYNKSA